MWFLKACSCKSSWWETHAVVRMGVQRGEAGGAAAPPPSLVRNINYLGNFYLRVGQSSCSCFVSLIFLIFSFHLSLAPCIKTHTKTQEIKLKRLYFSKFSWEACPWTPLEVLAPSARVGQIRVRPPKISKPVRLWLYVIVDAKRKIAVSPCKRETNFPTD